MIYLQQNKSCTNDRVRSLILNQLSPQNLGALETAKFALLFQRADDRHDGPFGKRWGRWFGAIVLLLAFVGIDCVILKGQA